MRKAIFIVILILATFSAWVINLGIISAGDLGFHFKENLDQFFSFPYAWDGFLSPGTLGYYRAPFLFSYFPLFLDGLFSQLGLSFVLIERLVWLFPFLGLSLFGSWYLAKMVFPKNEFLFIAPLVFLFNTYILMVVGGGQMGLALAYAVAPLVFSLFIKTIQTSGIKLRIMAGLTLGLQIAFDPRMALLTMGVILLYSFFKIGWELKKYFILFFLPLLIALGLHSYWLLPLILIRRVALPLGFGESGWVEFLSFADFSNSLSLLHPNWPENIFGKTYFMRPEFLLIPMIAFSILLWQRRDKKTLFFTLLGLVGAFLAKGSKSPLGEIYLWLFKNFPGMNFFRDPTKFYLLIALAYAVLIPLSLEQIVKIFKKKPKAKYFILGFFIFYWLFLIRPAWLGQLGGIFQTKNLPQEYLELKDFINNQDEFFRTFWLPKKQRFGFRDSRHPAINAEELPSQEDLALMGVKYVIIPFDSDEEIFLEDREYSHQQRLALEEELDGISWLKKIEVVDQIAVYETPAHQDHFSLAEGEGEISWQWVNPAKYFIQVKNGEVPFSLVFSEAFDSLWQVKIGKKIIPSKEHSPARYNPEDYPNGVRYNPEDYPNGVRYNSINSFVIDQAGDFEATVEFAAQKYVYWGLIISLATLVVSLGGLVYSWRRE